MEPASLFRDKSPSEQRALTIFRAEMIAREEANWRDLFAGFDTLKVITYSSGLDVILELAGMFQEVEVTFGSERILSREHAALEQASGVARGYTFLDAVSDQKAFLERLAAELGKSARALLPRVADGTVRFRVLRKMPSHEKLYLLAGRGQFRVITGSANLSLIALTGRQKEVYIVFEGEEAYRCFDDYYARDAGEAAPVPADYLVVRSDDGVQPRTAPIPMTEVPCVRTLTAGVAIVEERPKLPSTGLTAEALRLAGTEGARLRGLELDGTKAGKTVITATSFFRAYRAHQTAPTDASGDERIPRVTIAIDTAEVFLDDGPWLSPKSELRDEEIRADAALVTDYIASFGNFFGNAAGAIKSYWTFLCWLYAAPMAPWLRQAAIVNSGDPLAYPVFGILYGRPNGGKSWFSEIAASSMFGPVWKQLRGASFTANRVLGLREQLGAIPLLIDDVNRDRFTREVPDLVKFDRERATLYSPVIISTNKQVSAVSPDIRKRAVVCLIDAAIPDQHATSKEIAHRAHSRIGTALYRAYLRRLLPLLPAMREQIAERPMSPPDLLEVSSQVLRELIVGCLGNRPEWMGLVTNNERLAMNDRPLLDQLNDIAANYDDRIMINRRTGELTLNFGGDNVQANNFEKLVPAFALKRRFADSVTIDLAAVEEIYGRQAFSRRRRWFARLLQRG
ncbi:MAG: NgoFVII family restriction endonuclease [Deltaproteobacteria bacterium]|nr:NgoFVII family restriction endonuclease [Deltaproteobacteria bacterium]